jgi:hypothetical protein
MRRSLALLPLLLLVGCGQPKTKTPLTQGLPVTTNVWAQLSLVTENKPNNKANSEILQGFEALLQANPESRRNLAKIMEALGAIKDAGLGDLAKGDLKSVTIGATLPKNAALIGPSPADLQLVLILRGNFNPIRISEFANNNGLKQTEVGGAPTWALVQLIGKIAKEKQTTPDPFGFGLTAVDEHTLVIATPSVLNHAVAALQGKEGSLIAPRINVLDAYQDWQLLVVFSDRDLIANAAAALSGNVPVVSTARNSPNAASPTAASGKLPACNPAAASVGGRCLARNASISCNSSAAENLPVARARSHASTSGQRSTAAPASKLGRAAHSAKAAMSACSPSCARALPSGLKATIPARARARSARGNTSVSATPTPSTPSARA